MKSLKRAAITSVGHYVPPDVYDNHYFESFLETNDQWIRERTGIVERRFLLNGATSDMAVFAIEQCLERRGITAKEIECIIVATVTPDMLFPSTSSIIQGKIGADSAWGFDLEAACSSFLYALNVGARFIESGAHKKVLVVGSDKMTAITDMQDRNTAGGEPPRDLLSIIESLVRWLAGADNRNGGATRHDPVQEKAGRGLGQVFRAEGQRRAFEHLNDRGIHVPGSAVRARRLRPSAKVSRSEKRGGSC